VVKPSMWVFVGHGKGRPIK